MQMLHNLFTKLILKIFKTNPLNFTFSKHTKITIFLNLLIGVFILCLHSLLTYHYINYIPNIIILFNFALVLLYFLFSIHSISKAIQLDITSRNLENANNYNNSLTILYDKVKGFKHDFDNMVDSIGGFINSSDMTGLKKYYSSLRNDCFSIKNIQVLNPETINNPGIYNLIVSKYQKALDENIKINFEFFFDFNNVNIPIYNLSRILGILLDNAIEAAKECEEKEINLIFRESPRNNVQIIIIENTYQNKDIDTSKIFEKGISGKDGHTGLGLWEINQFIKTNNNVVLKTSKNDKYFRQQLEIYL